MLVVLVLAASSCPAAAAGEVSLVLETNKASYLVGEPLLIRATLRNETGSAYAVGRFRMLTRGGRLGHLGFTVKVANEDGDLGDIFSHVPGTPQSSAPTHFEGLVDRYAFPREVAADLTLYRVDVCAFAKPGTYRLKAALAGEEDRRVESEEVTITVVPFDETDDPIVKILSEEQMAGFGYSFVDTFYLDGHVMGFGSALDWDELQPIIQTVLKQGSESAFYPHARYLWFLRDRDWMRGGGTAKHALATEQAIDAAESFLKDYPDSWLAADVMRLLFFTHLANKEPAKALEVGKKALALDPVPAVVPGTLIPERVEELSSTVVDQAANTVTKGGD